MYAVYHQGACKFMNYLTQNSIQKQSTHVDLQIWSCLFEISIATMAVKNYQFSSPMHSFLALVFPVEVLVFRWCEAPFIPRNLNLNFWQELSYNWSIHNTSQRIALAWRTPKGWSEIAPKSPKPISVQFSSLSKKIGTSYGRFDSKDGIFVELGLFTQFFSHPCFEIKSS